MPEALPLEALYGAHYLLRSRPDLAAYLRDTATEGRTCPFYLRHRSGHCAVYPARPLVCRLFGFSATRNKDGAPMFRPCRHMPVPGLIPLRGAPIMSDAGTRLWGIEEPGATRQPFPALILGALDRLLLNSRLRRAQRITGRPPERSARLRA